MGILSYLQVIPFRKTWEETHTYDLVDFVPARNNSEISLQNGGANEHKLANLDVSAA